MGLLGSECSCGHLVTTPLTPRLSCLLQFPVPLRPDLWGLASHEVQRRNVAYRAVQPNPVVIFDESFHQSASLFEARGVGRTQGIRFYRLVPTFDLSVRLRGPEGEVGLRTYEQLKNRGGFSEELLSEVLRGMSARKYEETVTAAGKAFGVTPSSVSRHLVEATAKQLKQFQERSLEEFPLFAMYLDTVHRGGQAFVVALGVDREGKKLPLGFWEGATENHEICEELLEELERRGLKLSKRILWVTDGGGGIIKALKDRYGKKLIHQRCTLHKDRNIQRHLPKRYRKQAHHLFAAALEQNSYKDAKKMLQEFERWLRDINESAADSLLEALEEVLMLHKLKVPALLRQSLHSTNPIESMFSMVRSCERNIKRYRNSKMRQRWLAAVLLHCEQQFRRVKGHASIDVVVAAIDAIQREDEMPEAA